MMDDNKLCEEGQHKHQLDGRKVTWVIPKEVLSFGYTCSKCGNRIEVHKKIGTLSLAELHKAQEDGRQVRAH